MTVPADQLRWKKASSGTDTCVELAHTMTAVRDSKHPAGEALTVDMRPLLDAVRAGRLR